MMMISNLLKDIDGGPDGGSGGVGGGEWVENRREDVFIEKRRCNC